MQKNRIERKEEQIQEGRDVVAENRTEWTRSETDDGSWLREQSNIEDNSELDSTDTIEMGATEETDDTNRPRNAAALEGQFVHHFVHDVADRKSDYEYVDHERTVVVKKSGQDINGRIDDVFGDEDGDKAIIDVKNADMGKWNEATAKRKGDEDGRQVRGYLDSDGVDEGAKGTILATNPPDSPEIRNAYQTAAEQHDVDVKFIDTFDEDTMTRALPEIAEDSEAKE